MIRVALLSETATVPTRKHSNDAGIDLYADLLYTYPKNVYINTDRLSAVIDSQEVAIVGTGVTVEIPKGHFGWITNKSGNDFLIGGGIVDEGYQGELLIKIFNPLEKPLTINHKDKIAQFLIIPCKILDIEVVELSDVHKKVSIRKDDGGISRQLGFGLTWD